MFDTYLEKLQVKTSIGFPINGEYTSITIKKILKPLLIYTAGFASGSLVGEFYRSWLGNSGALTSYTSSEELVTTSAVETQGVISSPDKEDKSKPSTSKHTKSDKSCTPKMDGSKGNTSNSQSTKSQDRYAPETLDVSDPSGKRLDVTDQVLESAKETVDMASKGAIPKAKYPLTKRISEADFVQVEDDPTNLPLDTETTDEDDNIFVDGDTYQEDTQIDDESSTTDTQTKPCGPACKEPNEIKDPMVWIIASLKTIHNDMQLIKPDIEKIPTAIDKVGEVQLILGNIAGELTDQKTRIENMEKTLTTQRSDINRLTDIVMTYMSLPVEPKPAPVIPTQPKVVTAAEINITRLVEVISQKKNLTGEQEMILRNLITHRDKDIIITSLKDLGVKRPIMSAEIDLILQVDYVSAKGMSEVMKTLTGLIPEKIKPVCPPDCTMSTDTSAISKSGGKRPNPFRLN